MIVDIGQARQRSLPESRMRRGMEANFYEGRSREDEREAVPMTIFERYEAKVVDDREGATR